MKVKEELKEFRGLELDELKKLISTSEHELMNLRFRHASGQLERTSNLTQGRRKVARLKTILAEKRQSAS